MDPSTRHSGERGFSLIEVIVSVGLLAVVSLSVAQLFVAATEATLSAREQTTTAILASQKMEQLRGLTWGFEPESRLPVSDTTTDLTVDPPSPGGRGLSPSPAGVLTTSLPGYVNYLDAQGAGLAAVWTRRRAPATSDAGQSRRFRRVQNGPSSCRCSSRPFDESRGVPRPCFQAGCRVIRGSSP